MCGALCDRHNICRTADYETIQKVYRLFETLPSAGTFIDDPTTSILALNHCTNDQQTEPEYVCTRSGVLTVQQIFDDLTSATKMPLSLTDRGAYANMYGVYTSSYSGYISFFTYTGIQTILESLSSEVTNINSVPFNGLSMVQYYDSFSIIYKNIGDPFEPELVPILNIALPATSYTCVTTLNYLYIAYASNQILMTIHNLSTGVILYTVSGNQISIFRPAVTQWNDTIIIVDQCEVTEYSLIGVYQRSWTYSNGFQSSVRNYIHHDYAGRLYICNYGGTNPGIYVFLLNGTEIAHGPGSCNRAFQLYLTKEQAIFINTPTSGATMQIIDF